MDDLIKQEDLRFNEHDLVIRYKLYDHRIEFESKTGCEQPDGSFIYNGMTDNHSDFFPEFEKGERFIDGYIKWDGCSHFWFGDSDGYLHLCGKSVIEAARFVLAHSFEYAKQMKHWYSV